MLQKACILSLILLTVFVGGCDKRCCELIQPSVVQPPLPQPPCAYDVAADRQNFPHQGGSGEITVATNRDNCPWSVTSNVSWLKVSGSGSTSSTVQFLVEESNLTSTRTGDITAPGKTITITQDGEPPGQPPQPQPQLPTPTPQPACSYSVSPTSQGFSHQRGSGVVQVSTQDRCPWEPFSNVQWIGVPGGTRFGSGTFSYSVASNSGGTRIGTIFVAGRTVTIVQDEASVQPQPGPKASLEWKMCSGAPSRHEDCSVVGSISSSSYTLARGGDWKTYALVTHARQADCTISGTISSNIGGGGTGIGAQPETSAPNPIAVGYGFDSRVGPGSSYRISHNFVERCTGQPDNVISASVSITVQ